LVAASALAEKLRLIGEVLPPASYDNDLMADAITLAPQPALGLDDDSRLWRARKVGQPAALVFEVAARDGYSGRIGLIVAVGADGRMLALRVTAHKETPGLGDYIDPKKDRNKVRPWITQFNGLGLAEVARDKWRVKKDGGRFDQMAGATITARAVTNASGRALAWATENRDKLFALPANGRIEEMKP
jgi:electron transport complex protein RnfG